MIRLIKYKKGEQIIREGGHIIRKSRQNIKKGGQIIRESWIQSCPHFSTTIPFLTKLCTTILYLTKVIQSCPHLSSLNEFLTYFSIASMLNVSFLLTSPTHNKAHHKLIVGISCLIPPMTFFRYRRSYLESFVYYLCTKY